jgi:hypothetical protein
MTDTIDVLPIIYGKLQNDDTISAMCDGAISRGQPVLSDAKLDGTQHTGIIIPYEININSFDFVGGTDHRYDSLFEINIISKGRTQGDEESYSRSVMFAVLKYLQTSSNFAGQGFGISITSITPNFEPEISWMRWSIKGRAKGSYSST